MVKISNNTDISDADFVRIVKSGGTVINELNERINKAIEYIDNLKMDSEQEYYNGKTNMYEDYVKIIKNILKGEDTKDVK